jgi:hypothetical protein
MYTAKCVWPKLFTGLEGRALGAIEVWPNTHWGAIDKIPRGDQHTAHKPYSYISLFNIKRKEIEKGI